MLGVQFWLVPEPDNQYDPHAVPVHAGTETYNQETVALVGYIRRGANAERAQNAIDQPTPINGMVVGRDGHYGVKLDRGEMRPLTKPFRRKRLKDYAPEGPVDKGHPLYGKRVAVNQI